MRRIISSERLFLGLVSFPSDLRILELTESSNCDILSLTGESGVPVAAFLPLSDALKDRVLFGYLVSDARTGLTLFFRQYWPRFSPSAYFDPDLLITMVSSAAFCRADFFILPIL